MFVFVSEAVPATLVRGKQKPPNRESQRANDAKHKPER
jgi:hypothetical protein